MNFFLTTNDAKTRSRSRDEESSGEVKNEKALEECKSQKRACTPTALSQITQYPVSRFHIEEQIGAGSYGCVFKAYDKIEKKYIALKCQETLAALSHTLLREIDALKLLKGNENIIELYGVFEANAKVAEKEFGIRSGQVNKGRRNQKRQILIMGFEYIQDGDLSAYISQRYQNKGLPVDTVIDFTRQLLSGIEHIHRSKYIHRDIKPANILIGDRIDRPDKQQLQTQSQTQTENWSGRQIKIADFGLSRQMPLPPTMMTKEIQTLYYRAPEIILDNLQYSNAVDMWSIGVTVYEMLTGQVMFSGTSEIDQILTIFKLKGTPSKDELKKFDKYPHLVKLGSFLPKFKPKELSEAARSGEPLGSGTCRNLKNLDPLFYNFIEELTALEPTKRPSGKQALEMLRLIKLEYEERMAGGPQYYEPEYQTSTQ